jgi:YD repeat-containing protein
MIVPIFGQRLKGKVLSYRDTYYSVCEKFGKIKKGPKLDDAFSHDQYVLYDQNGNITQSIEYNSDGTIFCKYKGGTGYEDNNVESIYLRFDPEIIIDRKPFIMESAIYGWGEMYEMTYKNDSVGRPIQETIFDLMGNLLYKITIKRDEKGNSLEDKYSDGTVDQYKYDDKGNRIEWVSRSSCGSTTRTSAKYNASGNVIEMITDNFFKSRYKFHYETYTYKYLYDTQGNWIERIDYENNKPQKIVIRTIEYSS